MLSGLLGCVLSGEAADTISLVCVDIRASPRSVVLEEGSMLNIIPRHTLTILYVQKGLLLLFYIKQELSVELYIDLHRNSKKSLKIPKG